VRNKEFYILFILLNLFSLSIKAQCAMCKAAVEANLDGGGTKGAGLNEGILYLMATPYLAMLCFGIFYTLQKRKKNQPA
jgi:hypothetical protein